MNSVRCPVCDGRLTGSDCDDLTVSLREHLEKEHDIQELCNTPTGGVPPSTVARSYEPPGREEAVSREPTDEDRERMRLGNRLREAELRREQESWGPLAGSEVPPRTRGVSGWFRKTLGFGHGERPDVAGKRTQGEGYPDMAGGRHRAEGSILEEEYEKKRDRRREEVGHREPAGPPHELGTPHDDHVDCPMCGMHLSGDDENDLSIALREHMISMHEVAPLLTLRPRP